MTPEKSLGVIAALLVVLAVKAACIAMALWLETAAPAFMTRARHAYQARGKRCFVLGVINGVLLFVLFAVFVNAQIKPLGLLGVVILAGTVAAALTGYMLAYRDLGERLRGERGWSAQRTTVIGGLVAEVAFLTPVFGQIFSIGVLFRGLGATISAVLSRRTPGPPDSAGHV